jgi:regulator of replication initiation timing
MLPLEEQIANLERQIRELDARYTQVLVELARLRSETTTLKLMLDGADAVERSLRDRNRTQAETITRQRDDIAELSHGYRS